ncbi:MAG TPA: vWA domain-containing protein [Gammaproteobacteria bacterium]|nr:vWA domain-containing protein [Gammaproteobacteria bacterium]
MKQYKYLLWGFTLLFFVLAGCSDSRSHSTGVYLLIDTSGTYAEQVTKAQKIINYLLANLNTGDSLAVAKVSSKSFSEKDIIAKVTFDRRPSQANLEKRAFNQKVDEFAKSVKGSAYTDITGGLIQGAEYLYEANPGTKTIIIFSDLQEELGKGTVRDFPIKLTGIRVMAVNVTKLNTDNVDPRRYLDRLDWWEKRVRDAGATDWLVINDLEHLDKVLARN